MREIRIPAFAKLNLRLDVLGKRGDGYHELRTILHTISLHDHLLLRRSAHPGISLLIRGDAALSGEPLEKNLVYLALEALQNELNLRSGVQAELDKSIPAGRGLGGGSSDAAAALLGYLRLSSKTLPCRRLLALAASLGADVPFFLSGGRALGIGRGDEIYPLPDIKKLHILVVSPRDIHVPTPDAYRWLEASPLSTPDPALTKSFGDPRLFEFCALCRSTLGHGLSNDFEAPVFQRHPRLAEIKRALLKRGATEASLAGSGSAVFGVFPSPAMARRAAVGFPSDQTFVCETISRDRYLRRIQGRVLTSAPTG